MATGYHDVDRLTAGFQPSDLLIVAGRPGMGKTAFALNIAVNAALKGVGVAVFSLEMAMEQLVLRMLCSEARVDHSRLRTGYLRDQRVPRNLVAAAEAAGESRAGLHRRHPRGNGVGGARQDPAAPARPEPGRSVWWSSTTCSSCAAPATRPTASRRSRRYRAPSRLSPRS